MLKVYALLFLTFLSISTKAASNDPLTVKCINETKKFLLNEGLTYTKANESAVSRNCNSYPKEYLCYARKLNAPDADTSFANRPNLECECKVPYYHKGVWSKGC